jgi:hypothetical protein
VIAPAPRTCKRCGASDWERGRCAACVRAYQRTPEFRLYQRSYRYGLTVEQYVSLGTTCWMCNKEGLAGLDRQIDHDHDHCPVGRGCTDCVRGILCRDCNTLEGIFSRNPQLTPYEMLTTYRARPDLYPFRGSGPSGTRTQDQRVKGPLLYQLS